MAKQILKMTRSEYDSWKKRYQAADDNAGVKEIWINGDPNKIKAEVSTVFYIDVIELSTEVVLDSQGERAYN